MKTNFRIRNAAGGFALIVLMMMSSLRLLFPLKAAAADEPAQQRQTILTALCGGQSIQQWLDGELTAGAGKGPSEWYVFALALSGEQLDFSQYRAALEAYLDKGGISGATAKQRCALALIAASGTVPARCETLLAESYGKQGIMSRVFGLHLINNGVPSAVSPAQAAGEILAEQCADGGWSVRGDFGDPDVTAMALQAIAPYRMQKSVADAVTRGLEYLSKKQLDHGGFSSFGNENPESAAQVWIALNALQISPLTDARFVKNGHTLYDAVSLFDRGNGQYAHLKDGAANASATMQVFLALTSQQAAESGRRLYLFRDAVPEWGESPQQTTASKPRITEKITTASSAVTRRTEPASTSAREAVTHDSTQTVTEQTDPQTGGTSARTDITQTETDAQQTESRSETTVLQNTTQTEPVTAATVSVPDGNPPADGSFAYRIPLTAALWGVFLVISIILWLKKRRSIKTYLTLAALFALLTAGIWLLNFRTPQQYYQAQSRSGGGRVTMEIRCDVILGMPGSEKFPADGVILPETEFAISEGENALTLLYDAVRANKLQIEVDGVSGDVVETAYVRGIASLYEFDFGELSGWTYKVNGERPAVGCGAFTLHDGDRVVWEYTVNL